ncbi:MAG: class I SAM-dependent methyltransferase [Candidatus Kaiserbacteria bacterium]|nr:MAG: class I SAM-dependent methyltransferase [Candidatus Kaiserbacteria bacterium]
MGPDTPHYLEEVYWWAYVRPLAVRFWDRPWLINLILFGKYGTLRDRVLEEFGPVISGKTLQISCCYGELTPRLSARVQKGGGSLDVIDILPIQLENVKRKLSRDAAVQTFRMDAASLDFPTASYDQVLVFFLLHEEPQEYREKTMREALRILKPGGKIVIADYGVPRAWHPLRYILLPFLGFLEPTAWDLWRQELKDVLPHEMAGRSWRKTSYFGGLYQMLVSRG